MAALQEAAPPFDVVLLDMHLPQMDGFGVLAAMRAESRTRGMPVICVSALAREEDRLRAAEAGADGYVVKPFRFQDLIHEVDAALRRRAVLGPEASIARL